jgi:flagellar biosynthesis/type III secretory pathway protein FliH
VKLVEDHSITRGGCLFEAPFGETDATIEGQFDEIVSRIWEHREHFSPKIDPSNS